MTNKEEKHKTIVIDIDTKEIHTSNSKIRNLLETSKDVTGNPFSSFDLSSFEIVKVLEKNKGKTKGDKLDLPGIKKYIKDNRSDLTKELEELINSQAKDKAGKLLFTSKGNPKKTSFLVIKKWFYEKCPEQQPPKKENKK